MKKNAIFSVLALLFLWLVWIIACFCVRNEYLLPSFTDTMNSLGRLLVDAAFWRAFSFTLLRTLFAFALSLLLGAGLAFLSNLHPWVRAFFAPVVSVLRTVPTMAVILILLLWTSPTVAPVIVALLVLMPVFYAATLSGIDEVKERYGQVAGAFKVKRSRQLFKMYLPLAAPAVLAQAGSVFSMGLKIVISGEVLSSTFRSLGGMMQQAQIEVDIPRLLALTIVSVVLGFLLEGICAIVCRFTARWRNET